MTQYYLVAHDLGQLPALTIEPAGKVHAHRTHCWEIRTGIQVKFARRQLPTLLKGYHVGGTFDEKALFALPYEELVELIKSGMGPDDMERYEALAALKRDKPWLSDQTVRTAGWFSMELANLIVRVLLRTVRLVLIVLVTPFVIGFFSKKR